MTRITLFALGAVAVIAVAGALVLGLGAADGIDLEIPADSTRSERITAIDAWLGDLNASDRFNGGVALVEGGEPLLLETYGSRNAEGTDALTAGSSFRLASVSKQFTAAGILVLATQGRLDLDQPVSQIIDDFPYPEVTVRHLLNQTSGIPDGYMRLANGSRERLEPYLTIDEVAPLLAEEELPLRAAAGSSYRYSNTDYVLAAAVIEKVTGTSFEDAMRTEVFEPLGMTNSRVWNLVSADAGFDGQVAEFRGSPGDNSRPIEPTWIDGVGGDGAVFSSLEDLIRWDAFWRDPDAIAPGLVSADLLAEAVRPGKLSDGSTTGYGFGWVIEADAVAHGGAWLGARTAIWRHPERELLVVVLNNTAASETDSIAARLTRELQDMPAA